MNIRDKQIIRKILEEINVTEAMIESYDLDGQWLFRLIFPWRLLQRS